MDMHTATEKANVVAHRAAEFVTAGDLHKDIERVRILAQWLDSKFDVGGFKFGLQGVLGVLPVGGDLIATMAGFYPLVIAYRHNLGGKVVGRICMNLGLQFGMGLLPWVGDYADVWFKANLRNLAVLERAAAGAE